MRQFDKSNVVFVATLRNSMNDAPEMAGLYMISLNTTRPTGDSIVPVKVTLIEAEAPAIDASLKSRASSAKCVEVAASGTCIVQFVTVVHSTGYLTPFTAMLTTSIGAVPPSVTTF